MYLNCLESFKIRDKKVTTEYLMTFFDQLLRDLKYSVMNGQDHPSVKQRDKVVQREYTLYKQRQIENTDNPTFQHHGDNGIHQPRRNS